MPRTDLAQDPVFQLFLGGTLLINFAFMLSCLFGVARTAATRLPLQRDTFGLSPMLWSTDILSPRLRPWSGRGRKALKITVLVFWFILGAIGWLYTLYVTWVLYYSWAGWGLTSDFGVVTLHLCTGGVAGLTLCVTGVRRADRYQGKAPHNAA